MRIPDDTLRGMLGRAQCEAQEKVSTCACASRQKKSSGSFIMIVAGAGGFFTHDLVLFNSLFMVVRWSQDFCRRECKSPRACEEHP